MKRPSIVVNGTTPREMPIKIAPITITGPNNNKAMRSTTSSECALCFCPTNFMYAQIITRARDIMTEVSFTGRAIAVLQKSGILKVTVYKSFYFKNNTQMHGTKAEKARYIEKTFYELC